MKTRLPIWLIIWLALASNNNSVAQQFEPSDDEAIALEGVWRITVDSQGRGHARATLQTPGSCTLFVGCGQCKPMRKTTYASTSLRREETSLEEKET